MAAGTLREHELDHLPGYRGATPVRVGNAASGQIQLDVFGELMDSLTSSPRRASNALRGCRSGDSDRPTSGKVWDQPSADIWENRGEPRFTPTRKRWPGWASSVCQGA